MNSSQTLQKPSSQRHIFYHTYPQRSTITAFRDMFRFWAKEFLYYPLALRIAGASISKDASAAKPCCASAWTYSGLN